MLSLLERTRKINKLLQRSESVEYDGISRVLSNVIGANVYIAGTKGEIFGYAFVDDFECDLIDETASNRRSQTGLCAFTDDTDCIFNGKNTTIVPIYGVGERIGTLIIAKFDEEFTDDDLLLAEYGATVVGMEMLRDRSQRIEIEARKKAAVHIAIHTLSFSEMEAAKRILDEMDGMEKTIVASKLADQEPKITRSVIVNALRKFESAGVIESKSLGMRGTRIKIKNEYLKEEFDRESRTSL